MKLLAMLFGAFLLVAVYVIGFIYLMSEAIVYPVQVDPLHPIYSWWWIVGWVLYICAGLTTVMYFLIGKEQR